MTTRSDVDDFDGWRRFRRGLAWQRERKEKYPGGWEIPVLDADGVTELGTIHIGP